MSSLEAALAEYKDGPFFTNWKTFFKNGTLDTAKSCIDALVAPIAHIEDPRTGVISYAYSRTEQHRGDSLRENCVYFTELFADLESYQTHLTEAEAEPVVELFQSVSARVVGYVNSPLWHDGIKASLASNQAQAARTTVGNTLNPHPKGLLGGKWGRRVLPVAKKALMIELRIQPTNKIGSDRLIDLLTPLTKIQKTDFLVVSSYIVQGPGWWRRDLPTVKAKLKTRDVKIPVECYTDEFGSPETIEFRMICSNSLGLRHKFPRSLVAELSQAMNAWTSEFIVTAEDLEDEPLVDLLEYFDGNNFLTTDRRSLLSGFLLHPYYTKDWEGKAEKKDSPESGSSPGAKRADPKLVEKAPPPKAGFNVALGGALAKRFGGGVRKVAPGTQEQQTTGERTGPAFRIRRHAVKNQPEAVVLEARARKCPSSAGQFNVPLMDYLRTITRLGHMDKEVPIGTLFGVLERMRATVNDVAYMNMLGEMSTDRREEEGNLARVKGFFSKLSLMGRGGYQKDFGRKLLCIDGLDSLISTLETEYAVIVDRAKKAVANNAAIEYMGLQELYKIGSIVTSQSLGILASFKVIDCVYEPMRTLMGALRYSFRVTFETIVYTGPHFLTVPFTEIIGEWKNVKDLGLLPFQPVKGGIAPSWIDNRVKMFNSLRGHEQSFSYMEYPAGSFFPSLRRKNKSTGASSSSVMRVAPGQVIVDVQTGLNLGYAPASRTGALGIAMGTITKLYLDHIRKETGTKVNLSEMNNMNEGVFTAFESFPAGVNAQPWPCVVGFSMSTKSWGYAIVDRLVPVLPDPTPWNELVLPSESKEMLMSLAKSKVQRSDKDRYRYNDVIPGKGAGGLYLLYGPPGTGKTLTVEALARFFGKPLYSISFAELGSSTAELEEKLTVTLQLAAHWGCLALLDEGDALVEKRKQGQLLLNSMTGVLLRLLENFEGSLFINSNRVSSFDPAALSRVTLAVKFTPLTEEGMAQVWRSTIARVLKSDRTKSISYEEALVEAAKGFELTKLAKFPGSGRSVGAVMKMAIALCSHRDCDLTQSVLQECIANFLSFHTDLKSEGVQEIWEQ
jgi:hypothetical protein